MSCCCSTGTSSSLVDNRPEGLQDFTINNSEVRNIGCRISVEAGVYVVMNMEQANGFDDFNILGERQADVPEESVI